MEKKIQTLASLSTHSFSAYLDEVLLKNGMVTKRMRIDHPEATAVVPFISEGEIIMVRQFRYALGKETLEIPAGKMDPGERPEDCAKRELLEETGYEADVEIDEREISGVERLSLKRVKELIREGRILDGKTLIGLFIMDIMASW